MPEIKIRGFDPDEPDIIVTIGVTKTVLDILAEQGYLEQPYPIQAYLDANIAAGQITAKWVRAPEDKPDPAD